MDANTTYRHTGCDDESNASPLVTVSGVPGAPEGSPDGKLESHGSRLLRKLPTVFTSPPAILSQGSVGSLASTLVNWTGSFQGSFHPSVSAPAESPLGPSNNKDELSQREDDNLMPMDVDVAPVPPQNDGSKGRPAHGSPLTSTPGVHSSADGNEGNVEAVAGAGRIPTAAAEAVGLGVCGSEGVPTSQSPVLFVQGSNWEQGTPIAPVKVVLLAVGPQFGVPPSTMGHREPETVPELEECSIHASAAAQECSEE